jgi:hypothetical protein
MDDAAPFPAGLGHNLNRRRVSEVSFDENRITALGADHCGGFRSHFRVYVDARDGGTLAREQQTGRPAHARGRSSDHRILSHKSWHPSLLFKS